MDCDFLHILPELRDMFDAAAGLERSCSEAGSRGQRPDQLPAPENPLQPVISPAAVGPFSS